MKQIVLTAAIFLQAVFSLKAQKVDWKKLESLNPDKVMYSGVRKPTEVLLLGTFHFDYPNLDAHKTDSSKQIDVLSDQKQKELRELTEVIKRFKPTKVYIESRRQSFHDSLYKEYRSGRFVPGRNEIYQIGYRVAKEMNLPQVYAVDADSFVGEYEKKYTWIDSMWNGGVMTDSIRDKYWNRLFTKMYDEGDSLDRVLPLLENFLLMAEPATLKRMHGAYLTGGFNTKGNEGPDIISMWWFSRNLRIFNNVLNTRPTQDDRILILFGNGHMPILKQCFESSPEFRVVELKTLVKK
ncbi:MAG: hypothetical protein DI535_07885 [Citrobacter freundii]|nr:MAG: hypothetical protein DI535_07885 [Citrobacter freundii]